MDTVKVIRVKEVANKRYASCYEIVEDIINQGSVVNNVLVSEKTISDLSQIHNLIIVINLDYTNYVSDAPFGLNQGFEILKWIRIRGLLNQCILESNDDIKYWLENWDESVFFKGKGVTFVNYLYKDTEGGINEKSNSIDSSEIVKKHFKQVLDLKRIRHEKANWFSLYWNYLLSDNLLGNKEKNRNSIIDETDLDIQSLKFLFDDINISNLSSREKTKIDNIKAKIENIKLLCIDDRPEWNDFYKYALGLSKDQIFCISNDFALPLIEQKIIDFNPNVIFLDLRLQNEKGGIKPHELSGVKILKNLIGHFPKIPIVITSATDDSETIDYVKNTSGAFEFWQKKGIDSTFSHHYVKKEFIRLFTIIDKINLLINSNINLQIFKLEQLIKFKEQLPVLSLRDQELIIIDTNFWLSNDLADVIFKLYEVCNSFNYELPSRPTILYKSNKLEVVNTCKHKLIITNECLSELLKISKQIFTKADSEISLTAQHSLSIIKKLISENKIAIVDFRENTYDNQAYADPYIVDLILSNIEGEYFKFFLGNVPFTNDRDKDFRTEVKNVVSNKKNDYYKHLKLNKVVLLTEDNLLSRKVKRIKVNTGEEIRVISPYQFKKLQ